jgi:ankyrin repeat protein
MASIIYLFLLNARSSVISKCIERYLEALTISGWQRCLPLHHLLANGEKKSTVEDALVMIEKYPAALREQNNDGNLPLHIECNTEGRSSIISKCIELYPESLKIADEDGNSPLHLLLLHRKSWESTELLLAMIENYPAALQHCNRSKRLPLHSACFNRCPPVIISKCIELFPEAVSNEDNLGHLPLHSCLLNDRTHNPGTDLALMLIKKYPAAVRHPDKDGNLPIHLECHHQCRSTIVSKCIELYPQSAKLINDEGKTPLVLLLKNLLLNCHSFIEVFEYLPALSLLAALDPFFFTMKILDGKLVKFKSIKNRLIRRVLLNLIPDTMLPQKHRFEKKHLNYCLRSELILLLVQMNTIRRIFIPN